MRDWKKEFEEEFSNFGEEIIDGTASSEIVEWIEPLLSEQRKEIKKEMRKHTTSLLEIMIRAIDLGQIEAVRSNMQKITEGLK